MKSDDVQIKKNHFITVEFILNSLKFDVEGWARTRPPMKNSRSHPVINTSTCSPSDNKQKPPCQSDDTFDVWLTRSDMKSSNLNKNFEAEVKTARRNTLTTSLSLSWLELIMSYVFTFFEEQVDGRAND